MISPDLPDESQRFLTLGDLVQAPLSLWSACPVPDTVLNPGITTMRDTVAACKKFPVYWGGRQTLIF